MKLDQSNTQWEKDFIKHESNLQYRGLRLPAVDTVNKDPQEFPDSAMWRDTMRR